MDYQEFLASKTLAVPSVGVEVAPERLPAALYPFQRDLTLWALRKGRSALFCGTGMGKTLMQLAWAQQAGQRVLILAPLAVAQQTVREGARWQIPVTYAHSQAEAVPTGITITNYERLEKFDPGAFDAVVLDESSILANFTGKTKKALVAAFRETPMRLCCTATPAPNDTVELTNHADFLGIMSPAEMITMFFTPKGSNGRGQSLQSDHKFRLKGHARAAFFRWLASWSMAVTMPSDLGYDDGAFVLPPLDIRGVEVPANWCPPGKIFATGLSGVTERASVRRATIEGRCQAVEDLVAGEPDEQWLLWCGLNDEAAWLRRAIPGAVEVRGSDSAEVKAQRLLDFAEGRTRVLITKGAIAAFGLNLQNCARMAFVGINDSYQTYYQAIRRCWRFGQTRPVRVYVVLSDVEMDIYHNVLRKEREAAEMTQELIARVAGYERDELGSGHRERDPYLPTRPVVVPDWLRSDEAAA
jgi:hypothetical protein